MLISLRLPVSYTGLAPDKITPMPGVHKALHRSTLVFRLLSVFTFVYACWLFKHYSRWAACPVNLVVIWLSVRDEKGQMDGLDPHRILLNIAGLRSKFHIYEIVQTHEHDVCTRVVRKQVLDHASLAVVQRIRASKTHVEIQVDVDELADVYDVARDLSLPQSRRRRRPGKDGTWYALQIDRDPCPAKIRWWSDSEPDLQPVYKLRDRIVTTVDQIIRNSRNENTPHNKRMNRSD